MTNPIPNPRQRANRANALLSTGPVTAAGKQRSSLNAITHGFTSQFPILATEDPVAYQLHCRRLFDEFQPATPSETLFTQLIADTSWRLQRVPRLEAALFHRAANPASEQAAIDFDIVDANREVANLGKHAQRLTRDLQKTSDKLREIQADRRELEQRQLKEAAAISELHKHKGIPYDPAEDGFVFSKDQIEQFAQRLIHLNESRHIEYVRFHMPPPRESRRTNS